MVANARKTHGELYAAIAARDPDQAARLMRTHLEEFAARAEGYHKDKQ
jgi:DNA-binding FadR family transcriptional regulator